MYQIALSQESGRTKNATEISLIKCIKNFKE